MKDYKTIEDVVIKSTLKFTKDNNINCGMSHVQVIQRALRELKSHFPYIWVAYDFEEIESRPPTPGKYFVMRKDGNIHWEQWNGSGWAYNHETITHYCEISTPKEKQFINFSSNFKCKPRQKPPLGWYLGIILILATLTCLTLNYIYHV